MCTSGYGIPLLGLFLNLHVIWFFALFLHKLYVYMCMLFKYLLILHFNHISRVQYMSLHFVFHVFKPALGVHTWGALLLALLIRDWASGWNCTGFYTCMIIMTLLGVSSFCGFSQMSSRLHAGLSGKFLISLEYTALFWTSFVPCLRYNWWAWVPLPA